LDFPISTTTNNNNKQTTTKATMFFYIYLRSIVIPKVLAIVIPIIKCLVFAVCGYLAYLWYSCWSKSIARNLERYPDFHGVRLHVFNFACSLLFLLEAIGGALERVLDLGAREVIDKVLSAIDGRIMVNNQVGHLSGIVRRPRSAGSSVSRAPARGGPASCMQSRIFRLLASTTRVLIDLSSAVR